MDIYSGDYSSYVFKQSTQVDFGEVSMNSQMLSLYMQFDGKKDLFSIAGELSMEMGNARDVALRLCEMKLVVRVGGGRKVASERFMAVLRKQLSLAVGPLAEILIEDDIEDMGEVKVSFPESRIPELVETLARQIPQQEKKIEFQRKMLAFMKK